MSDNGNGNGNGLKTQRSRKWVLVLLVVSLATLGAFVPPLLSAWLFGAAKPLFLLSGAEWVSVITMVTAAYIGGNVWQKHVEKKSVSASGSVSLNTSVELAASSKPDSDAGKEA